MWNEPQYSNRTPEVHREPFLLQIFFAGRLGPEAVKQLLIERIDEAEEQLAVLNAIDKALEQELAGLPVVDLEQQLRIATLDNEIRHTQAEVDWAMALLGQLEPGGTEGYDPD